MSFLVKRSGPKIQLVGRSEFEQVQVSDSIPKKFRHLYSQAMIAFQSGQVLPALFMLRTLIEQHMRMITNTQKAIELRGEDLCDAYAKTLDNDFKLRFPSLKVIYGNLSEAMHLASADVALFESQIHDTCLHFEGLEIFERTKKKREGKREPVS